MVKTRDWRCHGCSSNEEVADQRPIQFQDEGEDLGGPGTVRILNFVGAAVTAVRSENTITITISGGGGSALIDHPISSGAPVGAAAGARYYLTGASGTILGESVAEGSTMEARINNPTLRAHWYINMAGL